MRAQNLPITGAVLELMKTGLSVRNGEQERNSNNWHTKKSLR
jgi:hypothetical protein